MQTEEDPLPDLTRWASTYFSNGRTIGRAQFAAVTREFIVGLLQPSFEKCYQVNRVSESLPGHDWWTGLHALARLWTNKITDKVDSPMLPMRLSFHDWGLSVFAGLRRIVGYLNTGADGFMFPQSWTENPAFVRAWADAVCGRWDAKLLAIYLVALEWDTCWIPLRYFSDRAAVAYLNNFGLRKAEPQALSLKNYQEHWRGPRGLDLPRVRVATIVDLVDDADETVFVVDAAASLRAGLQVRAFSIKLKEQNRKLKFEAS